MHLSVLFGIIALTSGFPFVLGSEYYQPFFGKELRIFYISSGNVGDFVGKTKAKVHDTYQQEYTLTGWDAEYFRYSVTNSEIYVDKKLPSDMQQFTFYLRVKDLHYNKAHQAIIVRKSNNFE